MIGQRGIGDDGPILLVYLEARAGIQTAHLFERLDQGLRIDGGQPVDLHARHGGQQRVPLADRDVQRPDRLFDDGHLVRRGVNDQRVVTRVGDDVYPRLLLGRLCCRPARSLRLLFGAPAHLLGHPPHLVRAGAAGCGRLFRLDPQQAQQLLADLFSPGVSQFEDAHQPLLALGRLFLLEDPPDFEQVADRIDGFQPVGGLQRIELAVPAEHRLELLGGRLGQQPIQGE